ncbi:hypothetical protein PR048_013727 [Dryococelus australis]|uniref:Uncharacterized protein n=1 Tax=Dryococelus australis TaxID=614101 RepID=A0ABQ9HTG0_9NEOP|nr:hypothetical protein PR048_013727 [Dryococelus australis]
MSRSVNNPDATYKLIANSKTAIWTSNTSRIVCIDGQPFSSVENDCFKLFISHLDPCCTLPSCKTLANEVIPKLYEDLLKQVKCELREVEFISTDMWTSVAGDDILSLIVHFVNNQLNYRHRCLGVILFDEVSHSADNIWKFITELISDWNLTDKVVAVVGDVRNVTAALEKSVFSHVPCLAHTP